VDVGDGDDDVAVLAFCGAWMMMLVVGVRPRVRVAIEEGERIKMME